MRFSVFSLVLEGHYQQKGNTNGVNSGIEEEIDRGLVDKAVISAKCARQILGSEFSSSYPNSQPTFTTQSSNQAYLS
jgi:hypothetical protein